MNIGPFRFAPPWWAWFAVALAVAILSALGVWQIERAHYKERLAAAQIAARDAGPSDLTIEHAASAGEARNPTLKYGGRYHVSGHYDGVHQLLLSDQLNGTQVGYRVWTPLVLENGIRVMIDRGWVAKSQQGHGPIPDPAAPAGDVTVSGFWRTFPQPGLGADDSGQCEHNDWPRALNFPGAATVRCQYRQPVANGLLLLDPEAAGGFKRDWDEEVQIASPVRHYLYAGQWFLMALIALGIFLIVNSRRHK